MEIQWPLVLFTALAGAGAWLFAGVCVNEFAGKHKPAVVYASVTAIVLLAVGGICSATHLSHPERMLGALSHPTSGIFLEAVMIFIEIAIAAVFVVLTYRDAGAPARKVLAVGGVAIAFAFTYSCGESYMMSAQEMWDTALFPPACICSPMPAGFALWMLFASVCKREFSFGMLRGKKGEGADEGSAAVQPASEQVLKIAAVEIAVGSVLACATEVAYGVATGTALGDYASFFWALVIFCGTLVPLLLALAVLVRKPENATPYAATAFVAGLAGVIGFRCFQWMIGGTLMSLFGVVV